ncbi:hypothetical protein D515_00651 [Grimontia indica]|uniref:Uncharacterized protein n=1 Tax=Grimontia indica TaxID=1056512 RepID=R1GW38_9GAMM|nr:hypothetical protein D515_00651 [Grimontia indica]
MSAHCVSKTDSESQKKPMVKAVGFFMSDGLAEDALNL